MRDGQRSGPWREALALALDTGTVFGIPIVHYKLACLAAGRVALAGDAAHSASPMVGGRFRQSLYDVQAPTRAVTPAGSPLRGCGFFRVNIVRWGRGCRDSS